ncbi:hypothetical protein [Demequina globuliformis]|uniref:hypothetical protein n=1 Tax=Demequina globuliformis TaxID=676202 RepID=UPI000784D534|nr:hypothetical protein [Demequina globuliformis]
MPWFKVTDTLMSDEKVLMMLLSERGLALGTWVACGTWSTQHLTDGKIPRGIVESFVGTLDGAETLVDARMWKRTKAGYQFINWAKYQPTKADVEQKREDERARVAEWRARKSGKKPQVDTAPVTTYEQHDTGVRTDPYASPVPTRPDPSRPPTTNSPFVGKETSVTREESTAPDIQPCGRKHDAARPCRGCAVAIEKAQAEDAREKSQAASSAARRDAALKQEAIDACDMCGPNGRLDNGRTCHHVESVGMPAHVREAFSAAKEPRQ